MKRLLSLMQFEFGRQVRGRRGTQMRTGACVILALLFLWVQLAGAAAGVSPVGSGLQMLSFAAGLNYALILLAAVSVFATLISEERETGTLPLLLAADVTGPTLAAGKLQSAATGAVLLLLTQLPLLTGAMFFGGVTVAQIAWVVVVLFAALLMWICVGLAVSVFSRTNAMAVAVVSLLVVLLEGSPLVLAMPDAKTVLWSPLKSTLEWLRDYSTTVALGGLLRPGSRTGVTDTLFFNGGVTAAALVIAAAGCVWWLPRSFEERRAKAAAAGRRLTRDWVGDPIAGKEFRHTLYGLRGLAFRSVAMVVVGGWTFWALLDDLSYRGAVNYATAAVMMVLLVDLWMLSGNVLGKEVSGRTLATLTLTGTGPLPLTWRKVAGLLPSLLPAFLVVAAFFIASGERATVVWTDLMMWLPAVLALLNLTLACSLVSPRMGWAAALLILTVVGVFSMPFGYLLVARIDLADGPVSIALGVGYFMLLLSVVAHAAAIALVDQAAAAD